MKKKLTGLLLILNILCLYPALAQENLARNGSFEEIVDRKPTFWRYEGWKTAPRNSEYYPATENPFSGSKYLVIENKVNNDARLIQDIQTSPLSFYKISCRIRAAVNQKDYGKAGATIGILEGNFQATSPSFDNTHGRWEYAELIVKTAEHTRGITICLRLGGFGSDLQGRAEFDDVQVEKLINPGDREYVSIPAAPVPDTKLSDEKETGRIRWFLIVAISIILIAGIILTLLLVIKKIYSRNNSPGSLLSAKPKGNFTVLDLIVCGTLTLVYVLMAFTHLGSRSAPETHWWPAVKGESFIADMGSVQDIRSVNYFEGLPGDYGQGVFDLEYSEDGETWQPYKTYTIGSIFFWFFDTVNFRGRYIKIIAQRPRFQLKEMAFFGKDKEKPLKVAAVIASEPSRLTEGSPENLFDEQETIPLRPTMYYGMPTGFDELYHARTAYELLIQVRPYESSHPPLGKLLISVGIMLFGMNPFGWRFIGTLMGAIMVILMYLFGKKLFKKTELAFICSFLMAFDFMHFVQTRIATIDTYGVFFIILMYYFMYQYFTMDFRKVTFSKSLMPLLYSGICWGLGAASKWIAIYAAIGLAVLFFITTGRRIAEHIRITRLLKSPDYKKNKTEKAELEARENRFLFELLVTLAWCVLVFIIIPSVIYILSYIPYLTAKGTPVNLKAILSEQQSMFRYHSAISKTATHPFSSPWYEWPLILQPMWYHQGQHLPATQTENLVALGNPAVWWIGSLATLGLIAEAIAAFIIKINKGQTECRSAGKPYTFGKFLSQTTNADRIRLFIIIGFASQYLPWTFSPRSLTFIYHFFASVPFIILALVYLIDQGQKILENNGKIGVRIGKIVLYFYLILVLILFIMFYPVLSYTIVDKDYMRLLKWMKSWPMY